MTSEPSLAWLEPGDTFPDPNCAWPTSSDAPGLLAAGGRLDTETLVKAYSKGIFPWYSKGQPILWWSTNPRMVLSTDHFKVHRSFKKTIKNFNANSTCEIRFDTSFNTVIQNCSSAKRSGQSGTWILPEMVAAYQSLHKDGYAHSVETWMDGNLVGGLYCVCIGRAVFGESMFSHSSDASKLALAALVAFCRVNSISHIDCQQNTRHLASMGATEMPRSKFIAHVQTAIALASPVWRFDTLYWASILEH